MKKWLALTLLLFCIPALVWGWGTVIISGSVPSGGDPCSCSGTYKSCYTGDYPGDTDKICYNSGNDSKDGTLNGEITVSSDYVEWATDDDFIKWPVTSSDLISTSEGTIYLSVYIVDGGDGDIPTATLFECYLDSSNYITIRTDTYDNYIRGQYIGSGTSDTTLTSSDSISTGSWYRIGYTWRVGEAGADHSISCVVLGNPPVWNDDDDDLVAWTGTPDDIVIGDNQLGYAPGEDTIRVKDLVILSTFKATDPLE